MLYVLLIMSPSYFIIYAYLHLVWQMFSFYFDGYAHGLFAVVCKNRGKCNVIILAFILLCFQILVTVLYILNYCSAKFLVDLETLINFTIPTMVIISICYLDCKFSGVPQIGQFRARLLLLKNAVSIWSATRMTRAIISFWDNNLVYGLLAHSVNASSKHKSADKDSNHSLYVPMLTIVIFCVVELCPIWYVLDGSFVDVFICLQ